MPWSLFFILPITWSKFSTLTPHTTLNLLPIWLSIYRKPALSIEFYVPVTCSAEFIECEFTITIVCCCKTWSCGRYWNWLLLKDCIPWKASSWTACLFHLEHITGFNCLRNIFYTRMFSADPRLMYRYSRWDNHNTCCRSSGEAFGNRYVNDVRRIGLCWIFLFILNAALIRNILIKYIEATVPVQFCFVFLMSCSPVSCELNNVFALNASSVALILSGTPVMAFIIQAVPQCSVVGCIYVEDIF